MEQPTIRRKEKNDSVANAIQWSSQCASRSKRSLLTCQLLRPCRGRSPCQSLASRISPLTTGEHPSRTRFHVESSPPDDARRPICARSCTSRAHADRKLPSAFPSDTLVSVSMSIFLGDCRRRRTTNSCLISRTRTCYCSIHSRGTC